jgi:integrase
MNKLIIRYTVAINRINNKGETVIICRITYNKNRIQFSTGLFINPDFWDNKLQLANPPTEQNSIINKQLSLIENKIRQAFLMLQIKEANFTIQDIYSMYKGEKIAKEYNVIEYCERFLKQLKRLVGIDITDATYNKYENSKNHIKGFIRWKFKKRDIPLKELKSQFLVDLEYYLKVESNLKQITLNKVIQRFRKPIRVAVSEGFLVRDPFMLYKAKREKKEIVFLTTEELKALENHQFAQPRLQEVRDWFVFSCYTGLAYNEIKKLRKSHIVTGFDGVLWIEMIREKTQKNIAIPILPKAKELMDAYSNPNDDKVFNVLTNQKYNSYLKEVTSIVGINKRLTTHIARKTFASTVLLFNDVPMEIVSELLGHSSIKITQESYGKVVQKKVSEQMIKLNDRLKK